MNWLPLTEWRQLPAMSGLYVIRHRESGREYVGKSVDIRSRAGAHYYARSAARIHTAIRKYGAGMFDVTVLALGAEAELAQMEVAAIAERNTYRKGYNNTVGGEGSTGARWSETAREACRLRTLGRRHSEETKRALSELRLVKNPVKGRKFSEASRAKLRAAHAREPRPAEVRAKISAALAGVKRPGTGQRGEANAMYGRRGGDSVRAEVVLVWPPGALTPDTFACLLDAAAHYSVRLATASDRATGKRQARDGSVWAYLE